MNISKHTPGPWHVGETVRGFRLGEPPDGMTRLCDVDGIAIYVAKSSLCDDPADDARLIAAAPDLLAALRAIAEESAGYAEEMQRIARAAMLAAGVQS